MFQDTAIFLIKLQTSYPGSARNSAKLFYAQGVIYLSEVEIEDVDLYDIMGREVFQHQKLKDQKLLVPEDVASGVYILKIKKLNENSYIKKNSISRT